MVVEWSLLDKLLEEEEADMCRASEKEACTSCSSVGSATLVETSVVCRGCGAVLVSDLSPAEGGDPVNPLLPRSSLGTVVLGNHRVRVVNNWWRWVYREKAFFEEKKHIERCAAQNGVPRCAAECAVILYKKVLDSKHKDGRSAGNFVIFRGNNRRGVMAASLYYGCKLQRVSRSIKEVSDVFGVEAQFTSRGCRFVSNLLGSAVQRPGEEGRVLDFVARFCANLGLAEADVAAATRVATAIQETPVDINHQPTSVAAAVVLYCCAGLSKKRVSQVLQVSEVTLTKTYKHLAAQLKDLAQLKD